MPICWSLCVLVWGCLCVYVCQCVSVSVCVSCVLLCVSVHVFVYCQVLAPDRTDHTSPFTVYLVEPSLHIFSPFRGSGGCKTFWAELEEPQFCVQNGGFWFFLSILGGRRSGTWWPSG